MKYFLVIITLLCIIISCTRSSDTNSVINENKDTLPVLYITKQIITDVKGKVIQKDSIFVMDSSNFNMSLHYTGEKKGHIAKKDIDTYRSLEGFKEEFAIISDRNGQPMYYKGTIDFLNYMSEHGYDMMDQKVGNYVIDYRFRRR